MNTPQIHPTALIAESVVLADNVTVGPYACIDGDVTIGEHCTIQAHAILTGKTTLGAHNTIGYGAVIGADPQDLSYTPDLNTSVVIGNHNTIREYCTIHRSATRDGITRVGDHCFLMAGSHVAHDCQVESDVIMANNCMLGGHVHIGDHAFLGGGVGIHQFVHIGRLTMIQGHASISQNVPPFLIATGLNGVAGMNIVGMRRAGFSADERREIKSAYQLLYLSGKNSSQIQLEASRQAWGTHGTHFFDFLTHAKKRGIVSPREN